MRISIYKYILIGLYSFFIKGTSAPPAFGQSQGYFYSLLHSAKVRGTCCGGLKNERVNL